MFFNRKKNKQTAAPSTPQENDQKPKVSLKKSQENLDNYIVRLEKEKSINLSKHRARVFVVIDRSGSMYTQYKKGDVQDILTRLLPLALRFDDNQELEVYLFNTSCVQVVGMNINNYKEYVKNEISRKGYKPCGGTNYAPAIELTMRDYNDGSPYPAFGIFITDGDNYDKKETDMAVRQSSNYKMFIQFVGSGFENFPYLEKLDDLSGRSVDNTGFVKVADFEHLSDEQLYELLLKQYLEWLKVMKIN